MNALLGKKLGMTRVFGANGEQVPVTVIQTGPCVVVQRKTAEHDGYDAVQVGFEDQKAQRLSKPEQGHFKKASVEAKKVLREIDLEAGEEAKEGDVLTVALFEGVSHVDISGTTKGKGFQGVVRRYGMAGGPAAHGHTSHRRPGSIGMREWPGRVLKNKKMPGQMGNVNVTTQNLKVVQVRPDDHVMLVHGAVPGPVGSYVVVRKSIKKVMKAT